MTTHTSHKKRWLLTAGGLLLFIAFVTHVDYNRVFVFLRGTNQQNSFGFTVRLILANARYGS